MTRYSQRSAAPVATDRHRSKFLADAFAVVEPTGNFLSIDIETNGPNPMDAFVFPLQIGLVEFRDWKMLEPHEFFLNWPAILGQAEQSTLRSQIDRVANQVPNYPVTYELLETGVPVDEGLQAVVDCVVAARDQSIPICGYNFWTFDRRVLLRSIRNRIDADFDFPAKQIIDVGMLAKAIVHGYAPPTRDDDIGAWYGAVGSIIRPGKWSLALHATTVYGVACSQSRTHSAAYDAELCGLVFEKMAALAARKDN